MKKKKTTIYDHPIAQIILKAKTSVEFKIRTLYHVSPNIFSPDALARKFGKKIKEISSILDKRRHNDKS